MDKLTELPKDLPVPEDDGAADHLSGSDLPDVTLPTTAGEAVNLRALSGRTVLYTYPKTGRPGIPLPTGWDQIPGARGCTPQSCAFRDHHAELQGLGARVYGLSTQDSAYQREMKERLHLPFELLSDAGRALQTRLKLPHFPADGETLYKRLTLICDGARIVKVFYPVFPSDRNAGDVIAWLKEHRT